MRACFAVPVLRTAVAGCLRYPGHACRAVCYVFPTTNIITQKCQKEKFFKKSKA